jgi:hypothetical protein
MNEGHAESRMISTDPKTWGSECGKALGDLSILRVEELPQHRGNGLLLGCDMRFSRSGFA